MWHQSKLVVPLLWVTGVALSISFVAVGWGLFALGQANAAASARALGAPLGAARASAASRETSSASAAATASVASTASVAAATSTPVPGATPAATATPAGMTVASTSGSARSSAIDAYRGLGSWVDMYDSRAWADPAATVRDMASHGVRTLYIETGNYHSSGVYNPSGMQTFIQQSHAHGMKVVAWYLPSLEAGSADLGRVKQAVGFKTSDGQGFDSFGLDIEATVVSSVAERNANLETLSKQIRAFVGSGYALGAIIPSPVGIAKQAGFWNEFPYTMVAKYYDVFVPMAYYTYHGSGVSAVTADATNNVKILRSQPGCSNVPIHLIGGIAENSSAAEVGAFASAARAQGVYGGSLYGWPGTTASDWKALAAFGS